MTIIISCSLGYSYCTFGFLIFIIDKRNFLYYSLYILTEKSLKHLCSIRALVPVSFFFFPSLSQAISLECEAFWVHFPARASKTLLRRPPVPLPTSRGCPVPSDYPRSCGPSPRSTDVMKNRRQHLLSELACLLQVWIQSRGEEPLLSLLGQSHCPSLHCRSQAKC